MIWNGLPQSLKSLRNLNLNLKSNQFSWRFFRKHMTIMKFPKYFTILSAKSFAEYLYLPSITNSFFINPTDWNEVQIILLSSLDASKEPGPYGTLIHLMKLAKESLAESLSINFNWSHLIEEFLPDRLKLSKMIPLFKSGSPEETSRTNPFTFRPFSKIIERIMNNRLIDFRKKVMF